MNRPFIMFVQSACRRCVKPATWIATLLMVMALGHSMGAQAQVVLTNMNLPMVLAPLFRHSPPSALRLLCYDS